MAQINNSQPSPAYVFQVNLETVNRQGHLVPNQTQLEGNQTSAEADDQKNHRSTYIPGLLGGENRTFKHGETFTAYGQNALYLKKLYVSDPASPSDLLAIVG